MWCIATVICAAATATLRIDRSGECDGEHRCQSDHGQGTRHHTSPAAFGIRQGAILTTAAPIARAHRPHILVLSRQTRFDSGQIVTGTGGISS
jgi:hypothetical protein